MLRRANVRRITADREGSMPARSGKIIIVVAAAASALCAATAFAGPARSGATYRGSLAGSQGHVSITLRISADGARVSAVTLSKLPIYCTGNAPPGARVTFRAATISAAGSFSTTGVDSLVAGPLKGQKVATLTLRGTFGAGGGERGVITTTYSGPAAHCGGKSSYSTRAG